MKFGIWFAEMISPDSIYTGHIRTGQLRFREEQEVFAEIVCLDRLVK